MGGGGGGALLCQSTENEWGGEEREGKRKGKDVETASWQWNKAY